MKDTGDPIINNTHRLSIVMLADWPEKQLLDMEYDLSLC